MKNLIRIIEHLPPKMQHSVLTLVSTFSFIPYEDIKANARKTSSSIRDIIPRTRTEFRALNHPNIEQYLRYITDNLIYDLPNNIFDKRLIISVDFTHVNIFNASLLGIALGTKYNRAVPIHLALLSYPLISVKVK